MEYILGRHELSLSTVGAGRKLAKFRCYDSEHHLIISADRKLYINMELCFS